MSKLKNIKEEQLDTITGGATSYISGTIINAFVNVIKLLSEAGVGVGSSIRRVANDDLCPLK